LRRLVRRHLLLLDLIPIRTRRLMFAPGRALGLSILLSAGGLSGAPVVLKPAFHGIPAASCAGELRLSDRPEASALGDQVTIEVAAPVQLSLVSKRCWAPTVLVAPDAGSVDLPVWPAATVRGTFALGERVQAPKELMLRLSGSADGKARSESQKFGTFETPCEVRDKQWRCNVPAGLALDARLEAKGFIPIYFWDLTTNVQGVHDLGALEMRRGASVRGWVRVDGASPRASLTVQLELPTYVTPDTAPGKAVSGWKVSPNARGFFQFSDVPPGIYNVVARAGGLSPARVEGVRIDGIREVALAAALVLQPLASLDVIVSPPLQADGKPWGIELDRVLSDMLHSPLTKSIAGPEGRHLFENIEAGNYSVAVLDARGSVVRRERLTVDRSNPPLLVHLDQIPIRGKVRSGDRPVRAGLVFQTIGSTVEMQADESGSFAGMLPQEAKYKVFVQLDGNTSIYRRVDVRRKAGEDVAVVDLTLPAGHVKGRVTDEEGHGVAASISVTRQILQQDGSFQAGPDGSFDMTGFDPGEVTLRAETASDAMTVDAQSAEVPYSITEDSPRSAQLIVRKNKKIKLWVSTAQGFGVPGAVVRYYVPETNEVLTEATDTAGRCTLTVPGPSPVVTVTIMPAGYPIHIAALDTGDRSQQVVIGTQPGLLRVLSSFTLMPPTIQVSGGMPLPVNLLIYPRDGSRPRRGVSNDGYALELDSGDYRVCVPGDGGGCSLVSLAAGTERTIDARNAPPRPPRGSVP
jgi:hypothetical protein